MSKVRLQGLAGYSTTTSGRYDGGVSRESRRCRQWSAPAIEVWQGSPCREARAVPGGLFLCVETAVPNAEGLQRREGSVCRSRAPAFHVEPPWRVCERAEWPRGRAILDTDSPCSSGCGLPPRFLQLTARSSHAGCADTRRVHLVLVTSCPPAVSIMKRLGSDCPLPGLYMLSLEPQSHSPPGMCFTWNDRGPSCSRPAVHTDPARGRAWTCWWRGV